MLIQKSHRWRYLSLVIIALFGISGVTASALGTERPELTANEEVASIEKQDITIENVDDLIWDLEQGFARAHVLSESSELSS